MTKLVRIGDERVLAVDERGEPGGKPVFLLHGTPGSRVGPSPDTPVIYELGVRLITYDRPGYGKSDRRFGRTVADVAEDVAAIADALELDSFAVIGRSGGAPHALACAALLPDRTTRAAALVTLAPPEAEGLDWFQGMAASNVIEYMTAASGHGPITALLAPAAARVRADPTKLVPALDDLPEPDRRVMADGSVRRMLAHNFAEALRRSTAGWVDDALALCSPWGFDPRSITVPTLLWHGEADVFSPVEHSRWLGRRIPGATVVIQKGAAHFGALQVLPEVLAWAVEGAEVPGLAQRAGLGAGEVT